MCPDPDPKGGALILGGGVPLTLPFIYLFNSCDKTKASSLRDIVPKATQTLGKVSYNTMRSVDLHSALCASLGAGAPPIQIEKERRENEKR